MPEETQIQQPETNPPTQSYISRVRLKGYKSIIDTEVTFKPGLNIIIGANGSGKTNFVEFLTGVIFGFEISPVKYSAYLLFYNMNKEIVYNYDFFRHKPQNSSKWIKKSKEYLTIDGEVKINHQDFQDAEEVSNYPEWYTMGISKISFFVSEDFSNFQNLEKFRITEIIEDQDQETGEITIYEEPYYISSSKPSLTLGLEQLLEITFKDLFKKSESLKWSYSLPSKFISTLEKFSPIKNVKLSSNYNPTIKNNILEIENLRFEFLVNDQWLTWNQLSDGTKRMFYIITEITFANNIVLLEEPELGIHPDQLRKLMSFLREQAQEKQIIITTHSPQVLNALAADELDRIIIARYEKEAGTQLYHLTEDEIAHARSYMEMEGLFLSDYWVYSGFEKEEEAV